MAPEEVLCLIKTVVRRKNRSPLQQKIRIGESKVMKLQKVDYEGNNAFCTNCGLPLRGVKWHAGENSVSIDVVPMPS